MIIGASSTLLQLLWEFRATKQGVLVTIVCNAMVPMVSIVMQSQEDCSLPTVTYVIAFAISSSCHLDIG